MQPALREGTVSIFLTARPHRARPARACARTPVERGQPLHWIYRYEDSSPLDDAGYYCTVQHLGRTGRELQSNMIALESITPGLSLTGLDSTGIGSVIAVVPIADGAVQVLYKTHDGVC